MTMLSVESLISVLKLMKAFKVFCETSLLPRLAFLKIVNLSAATFSLENDEENWI